VLLEQRGALLHLTFDSSSGLGNCAQHILPADNHADDIGDWNHRLGALPALAGKVKYALSLQHCMPYLPLQNLHMDHANMCPGSKRQRSASEASLSLTVQPTRCASCQFKLLCFILVMSAF